MVKFTADISKDDKVIRVTLEEMLKVPGCYIPDLGGCSGCRIVVFRDSAEYESTSFNYPLTESAAIYISENNTIEAFNSYWWTKRVKNPMFIRTSQDVHLVIK